MRDAAPVFEANGFAFSDAPDTGRLMLSAVPVSKVRRGDAPLPATRGAHCFAFAIVWPLDWDSVGESVPPPLPYSRLRPAHRRRTPREVRV